MKHSQKSSFVSWIVIIIIIIVAVCIYISNNKSTPSTESTSTPTPTVTTPVVTNTPVSGTPSTPVVTAPSATVTVVSPNGGEKIDINKSYTLTWDYTGLAQADTISISLVSENNVSCWIGRSAVANKRYDFTASACGTPNNPLKFGKYKIKLVVDKFADSIGVVDESNTYFDIVQAF